MTKPQTPSIMALDEFVAIDRPSFETARLLLLPLKAEHARQLVRSLLDEPRLAAIVPWMKDRSPNGATHEAFRIELECNVGRMGVWAVVERRSQVLAGALLASASLTGTQLEVLLAPEFWDLGYSKEAQEPMIAWLVEESPVVFGLQ